MGAVSEAASCMEVRHGLAWPIKKGHESMLERTQMRMVRSVVELSTGEVGG